MKAINSMAVNVKNTLSNNFLNPDFWLKLVFILVFFFALYLLFFPILIIIVIIQFGSVLITGKDNEDMRKLSATFGNYILHIILYLTYNREDRPFPFSSKNKPSKQADSKDE